MSAPVDILLDPLPNLILHSAIFIAALIIMILWINGTIEHPWAPTILMFGFAFFNLLLSIRNKMINGSSSNTMDAAFINTDGNVNDEEVEGAHEVHGGRTIKNPYVTSSATPSTTSTETLHTHDPGAKHGGSPTGRTQQMGTTYQATQKNKSPEVTNAEELAKQQADIKARMSPPAQQANYTSDMGPDVNFFPDN
jgi:hypothetical protein